DELRSVRRLVERVMCEQRRQLGPASRDLPDTLFDHYLTLLKQEVAEELADEVMAQVRAALTQEQLADAVAVRAAVQTALASLIPADDQADAPAVSTSGRPRIIALIGPTGVGKTTT